MAKQKKAKPDQDDVASILKAFTGYLESNGKRPASIAQFCTSQNLEPSAVKTHFKTLAALEKAVWLHWFEETVAVLSDSEDYKSYSARERLLAFYYTWMDTVKPVRNYVKTAPALPKLLSGLDLFLADMQRAFLKYAKELVQMALANEEIMKRPVLPNYYANAMWQQFLFIMNYWIKDSTEGQGKTDEAIERSVNLVFELAGRNQMDSIVDFAKFLFKPGR